MNIRRRLKALETYQQAEIDEESLYPTELTDDMSLQEMQQVYMNKIKRSHRNPKTQRRMLPPTGMTQEEMAREYAERIGVLHEFERGNAEPVKAG